MNRIRKLKQDAIEATKYRRHDMGNFKSHGGKATATCRACGMTVTVNPRPLPNEIDICGEAVALNCGDKPY